mmetsp:Transcript_2328/g.3302  ORF Transcript_2328/g.3302 Transcript_2328/m.3302 type:complete len:248 (-) Transcript_2328:1159-1902(-)
MSLLSVSSSVSSSSYTPTTGELVRIASLSIKLFNSSMGLSITTEAVVLVAARASAAVAVATLSSFFFTEAFNCPQPASISIPLLTLGVAFRPNSLSSVETNACTPFRPLGDPSNPPVGFNGITLICTISLLISNRCNNRPSSRAVSGVSFSFSINAHSSVTLRLVVYIYSRIVFINSSKPPYRLFAGSNALRSSSLAQCRLNANRTCISSSINFLIFGTTPTVETVIFLAPIPNSSFILRIAPMTLR